MTEWSEVALGDICEFKYGRPLPAADRSSGPFPVYGSNGQVGTHTVALTNGPTIVVGRKGSFGEVHYSASPCWPIDTTYFVDSAATKVDLRWLSYRLDGLGLRTLNRAAAIPGLNREDAYRQRLLLPSLHEQKRIAAILDQADALRAKRRQVLAHFDALTQSIFHDMFGDPLGDQRGTRRATLGDLARVTTGASPSRSNSAHFGGGVEWIKSHNLGETIASRADESLSLAGAMKSRVAPSGSVLVTCIAGSPASIGKCSLVDREVAFNQQINAVMPSESLDSIFLLAQLKTSPDLVRRKSTGGMKGLVNKSAFESIEVLCPPIELQKEFSRAFRQVHRQVTAETAAARSSDVLFISLQSRAFRGEL